MTKDRSIKAVIERLRFGDSDGDDHDVAASELERLQNKVAALILVTYGTPENPRNPLAPGGSQTQPNQLLESGTERHLLTCENCRVQWTPRPARCPECGHPHEPKADPVEARARANFNLAHGINEGAWDNFAEANKGPWRDAARRQLDAENR